MTNKQRNLKELVILLAASLSVSCTQLEHLFLRQDVEFIKDTIRDNYPYLQVHVRRDGFNWEQAFEKLKRTERVEYNGKNTLEYLSQYLSGLNGHVHLIDQASFPYYEKAYTRIAKTLPEYKAWVEVLTRESVRSVYNYGPEMAKEVVQQRTLNSAHYAFTKTHENKIVYLKVPIFDDALTEVEGPRIVEFLKKFSEPESVIIFDVRGNGGGSDTFWTDYLVKPLISSPLEQSSVIIYKGGEKSMRFLESKKIQLFTPDPSVAVLGRFSDRDLYRYYSVETTRVEPTGGYIPHGKVVVLMDHSNFSASESFVSFCKTTGFATTVGKRSGGDGIGFDPILVELPYSHFLLALPISGALNSNGKLNYEDGTEPDIVLEDGIDPLEFVKYHWMEF